MQSTHQHQELEDLPPIVRYNMEHSDTLPDGRDAASILRERRFLEKRRAALREEIIRRHH